MAAALVRAGRPMTGRDPYDDQDAAPLVRDTIPHLTPVVREYGPIYTYSGLDPVVVLQRDAARLEADALRQGLQDANAARRIAEDRAADLHQMLTENDELVVRLLAGCVVLAVGVILAWRHR